MRLAVSNDGKTFGEPRIVRTPVDDFEEGMRQFGEIARELVAGEHIQASAGGIAGPMNRERTILVNAPHISGWNEKPLKERLEKELGAMVYLENDTALVGLGEATAGAARGYEIAVYVTISTGVGGVRIVDGMIDRSARGFEIGHQIIESGEDVHTPKRLEECISGSAFEQYYGKKPHEVTDPAVWEEAARILAYGLNNSIVHWSPDVVVLGGPMIVGNPAIPFERVKEHLKNVLTIFPELPAIKKAELGDVGGLHGALAFLHAKTT